MTQYIDILFACPPGADFPSLVEAQDDTGAIVQVGRWIEPTSADPYWRYRLSVPEMVMELVAGVKEPGMIDRTQIVPELKAAPPGTKVQTDSRGRIDRAALRQKLSSAKTKNPTNSTVVPPPPPKNWVECPSATCRKLYDPQRYDLVDCIACGEAKCSVYCIPNAAEPCRECKALEAGPDDDEDAGFDPSAVPDNAPGLEEALAKDRAEGRGDAAARRVFDGVVSAKGKEQRADDEEE